MSTFGQSLANDVAGYLGKDEFGELKAQIRGLRKFDLHELSDMGHIGSMSHHNSWLHYTIPYMLETTSLEDLEERWSEGKCWHVHEIMERGPHECHPSMVTEHNRAHARLLMEIARVNTTIKQLIKR